MKIQNVSHLLITDYDRAERVEIQAFLETVAISLCQKYALILGAKDHCFSLLIILEGSGVFA